MSEKRWAKGPWSFDGTGPHAVFGCEIESVDDDCIAGTWHGKDDVARANANLIAAAPELYDALEDIVNELSCDLPDSLQPEFLNALKAMAKARGES